MYFSLLPRDMGYGSHQRQRGVLTAPPIPLLLPSEAAWQAPRLGIVCREGISLR